MKAKKLISLTLLVSAFSSLPAYAGTNRIFYVVSDEMSMTQKAMSTEAGLRQLENEETEIKSATASDTEELNRAFLRATISNGTHLFMSREDFVPEAYGIVKDNPELKVVVMGASVAPEKKLPNLYAVSYDDERAAFLAGYTSGALSETKKVALLVSEKESGKSAEIKKGFIEGVTRATAEYGRKVKISSYIAEELQDDLVAEKIAGHIYSSGADIIYFVGETGLHSIHSKAKELGKKVIYVKREESSYLYPESEAVLASAVKNNTAAVKKVFGEINSGAHEEEKNIILPLEKGIFEYRINPAGHRNSEVLKEIEKISATDKK